ncbi:hypothetical protein BDBG_17792 [Blastomyces gilchristii SLH14081]|uniref:Uncharacterized protein n=1 Tax=Blastomyces gilchristii (strain SLH14081) TaxID=559298 RepID=A0A179V443_BLAGS|nr:uncharacterized protein BDBG_17792 [Blastomyces gilchristii SLH14081]OAT13362.1 hypothetical protein BDBG_17792 [Blastomyces gilchristii SLH14081]
MPTHATGVFKRKWITSFDQSLTQESVNKSIAMGTQRPKALSESDWIANRSPEHINKVGIVKYNLNHATKVVAQMHRLTRLVTCT